MRGDLLARATLIGPTARAQRCAVLPTAGVTSGRYAARKRFFAMASMMASTLVSSVAFDVLMCASARA